MKMPLPRLPEIMFPAPAAGPADHVLPARAWPPMLADTNTPSAPFPSASLPVDVGADQVALNTLLQAADDRDAVGRVARDQVAGTALVPPIVFWTRLTG